jgi:hypothetical protein
MVTSENCSSESGVLFSSVDMPKGIMVMNRNDLQKQLDAAPIEGKGEVPNTFFHPVRESLSCVLHLIKLFYI